MKCEPMQLRRRAGFTLIEVIVVIAIIAVLASLLAGAVFKILASQAQKRTEATVKKLQTGLSGQWQAVIDSVKDELNNSGTTGGTATQALYTQAKSLALGDQGRLRALYVKLRLIQEFPTTFAEAVNPAGLSNNVVVGSPGTYSPAAKATYKNAFPAGTVAPGGPVESAICLYLAINQGRRGATFNVEDVGAGSVKSQQCGAASLSYFVDSWGQPITFERWTTDAKIIAELSATPYAPNSGSLDKDDPDGSLYTFKQNPLWNLTVADQVMASIGHPKFSAFGAKVGNQIDVQINSKNWGFVIRSMGPNKNFGDGDDILGFRLMKEGNRGSN